jgi:hypothetical protein
MSVLTGQQLQEDGTDRPSALAARLPNVHLDGAADGLKITIRGVSNADTTEKGDPSAAFMLDGIYIARPQSQNASFYDIERIEVLRGPQGTLYGRNTTAGVVNVISRLPQPQFEGAFSTELGNYNSRKASAMLNVPAGPALALRAAVDANTRDSYLNNAQGTPHRLGLDRDDRSTRLSALLTIAPGASLLLRHDRSSVRDNNDSIVPDTNFFSDIGSGTPTWYASSTAQRLTNGFVPPNGAPEQGYSHKTTRGTSVDLSWDLPHATLHYQASRREYSHDALANFYYRIVPTLALGVRQRFTGDYTQDSHELRIATNGGGRLSAQAGLYYFREESTVVYGFRDLELLGLPPYYVFPHGPTLAHSRAVFGQASYQLDGGVRLTAGARYTEDAKSRVGSTNFQQAESFNPATDFKLLNAAALDTGKATWRLGALRHHRDWLQGRWLQRWMPGRNPGAGHRLPRRSRGARRHPVLPAGNADLLRSRPQDPLLGQARQPEPGRLQLRLPQPATVGGGRGPGRAALCDRQRRRRQRQRAGTRRPGQTVGGGSAQLWLDLARRPLRQLRPGRRALLGRQQTRPGAEPGCGAWLPAPVPPWRRRTQGRAQHARQQRVHDRGPEPAAAIPDRRAHPERHQPALPRRRRAVERAGARDEPREQGGANRHRQFWHGGAERSTHPARPFRLLPLKAALM